MTLNQLRYIAAFHEHGNVNETAKKLRVSSNQVRHTLYYINRELNGAIFRMYEGDNQPISFTDTGKVIARLAKSMVEIGESVITIANAKTKQEDHKTTPYQNELF